MPSSRVLIIDDNPIALETLASTLRLRLPDTQVETAGSAVAALERIRSGDYAVVICDGHQPRMDGAAFARAVGKIDSKLPVLPLLDKYDPDTITAAIAAGAYDVLLTPIDPEPFLLAVRRALEASQLRREVKLQEQKLLTSVRTMLKDLEVLYGAHGLQAHFEAFMESVKTDKTL
jgi:DNA-binding NtrC family response regulator